MKKVLITSIMIALGILMYSCSQNTAPVDSQSNSMGVIASQVLPDELLPSLDNPDMIDGSLDNEISNTPEFFSPTDKRQCPNDRAGMGEKLGMGFKFRMIFVKLQLDEQQKSAIARIMTAHAKCVREVMQATDAQRKEIIKAGNNAIKDIIKQVKKGDLTKREAAVQIKQINERVRAALAALVDKAALCRCWTIMVDDIKAILTPRQLELFNAWLANHPGPCAGLDGNNG